MGTNNGTITNDTPIKYVTKIGASNYFVNEETKRISYLDARFYACGPDQYVPSVTTILDAYPKGAGFYEWLKKNGADSDEIRDEAGRKGSKVHELTEILDNGGTVTLMDDDGSPRYKLAEWSMLERFVDFRKRFPAEIYGIELNLASAALGYGGTLDRLMKIEGELFLVDIKTSKEVWPTAWLQLAAYRQLLIETGTIAKVLPAAMLGDMPTIHLAVLHLNSKHRTTGPKNAGVNRLLEGGFIPTIQGIGWQFVTQPNTTEHYLNLFEKTRALWLAEHANEVPKLTSYQLQHSLKA